MMRREGRRMAKHKGFFQEHLFEENRRNVLVSLVHCKVLPSAIEMFCFLGKTAKQKSIYLSHGFHHFPCYFG